MLATRLRRAAALALLTASLIVLGWGLWPHPPAAHRLEIPAADLQPEGAQSPAVGPGIDLMVEWPGSVRCGDVQSLLLEIVPQTGSVSAWLPEYATLVEARLELPGVEHSPPGEITQALLPDHPVRFRWEVRVGRPGAYPGTLWLHLRFRPPDGELESRKVLLAQRLEVRAASLLGLTGPWARALGSAGALIGAVFGLDSAAAWLWRRARTP